MLFKRIEEKRGIALITAMWILTILVVVTASFAFMMRTEIKMAYHHRNEIKAYYIAMAGIESAIANLRSGNYPNEHRTDAYADCAAVPGGVVSNVSFGDGRYSLLIMDEQAKININSENNNTGNNNVRNLLGGGYGAPGDGGDDHAWPGGLPEVGPVYAAHIIDWADIDSTRTVTGAATDGYEDAQYQASTPSRYCKDAPFDTPDEVVMVQEFDYRRYWGEDRGSDGCTPSGGVDPLLPGDYLGPDYDGSEANYILDSGENGIGGYNDAGTSTVRMENLRNYVTVWSYIPTSGSSHPDFPYPDNTVKEATARAPINVNRVSRVTVRALYDPIYLLGVASCDDLYDAFVAAGNIADRATFNTVVENTLDDGTATRLERCAKSNSDPTSEVYNLDTLKADMTKDPTPYVWTTETCFKSYTYKIESTGEVLVGGNVVATRKIVAVVNIDANNDGTIGPVKTLFWRDVFLEHQ